MGSFGGFYKGDKKKKKKGGDASQSSGVFSGKPVFVMPKMLDKKKKKYE
jgi:hypothetical protein